MCLGVVLLVAGVFVYIQKFSNDSTKNWKTYTNIKYGYEIKYPPTWSFREFPDTKTGAGFSPDSVVSVPETEIFGIAENGRATDDCGLSFEDYVKVSGIHNIQNFEKLHDLVEAVTKSGVKGYKTTWDVRGQDGSIFESGPFTYFKDITQQCSNEGGEILFLSQTTDYSEIYNQMLQTFKFVKE